MGFGNYPKLAARVRNQSLRGVKVGELMGYERIARLKPIDLLVHRDCFERELLFGIVLSNAPKAGNGLVCLFRAHAEVAEHVKGSQITLIVINELTILFDSGVDFSL